MGKVYQQGDILNALDLNSSLAEAVNVNGTFTFTGNHTWNGSEVYNSTVTYGSASTLNINSPGNFNNTVILSSKSPLSSSNTISDRFGNLRVIPVNVQGAAYVLQASDVGKFISISSGGISIPSNVFSAGDNITIFNNSANQQTIYENLTSGNLMYLVGTATTGNRLLAQRGLCTILCVGTNTFVITGGGVT